MRPLRSPHRWLPVLMATLFLVGTSGVTVSRMTCLLGGPSIVGLGDLGDRCPVDGERNGVEVRPECCVYSSAAGERIPVVVQPGLASDGFEFLMEIAPKGSIGPVAEVWSGRRMDARPPPLLVSERLQRLSLLRV